MSPPPSKRARTNSTSSETITMETKARLKQHENLWFEDGNIVLATDVHLYCVHRGVLARNSTFFKEMLELPNVGNSEAGSIANGDSWEGKPLVRMVGDSDEDVYHILMALYDARFYCAHKPATPKVIFSLIRMSTKYQFSLIKDEVLGHIEPQYPTDFKVFNFRCEEELFADDDVSDEDDFKFLVVAQQCDMKTFLPLLYFDCAAHPLDVILNASNSIDLHKSLLLKILRGHERLSSYQNQYGTVAFLPHQRCTRPCHTARMKLFEKYQKGPPDFPVHNILAGNDPLNDDENLRASICESCSKQSSEAVEDFRLEAWNAIPGMFELGTWEDYKSE